MKYYLLSAMKPVGEPTAPASMVEINRRLSVFHDELREAGAWVFAGGLHRPDAATVLRPLGDEVEETEGPYAENKEFLGGICLLMAPDLDVALEWGRKAALATTMPVEVRPFLGQVDD